MIYFNVKLSQTYAYIVLQHISDQYRRYYFAHQNQAPLEDATGSHLTKHQMQAARPFNHIQSGYLLWDSSMFYVSRSYSDSNGRR